MRVDEIDGDACGSLRFVPCSVTVVNSSCCFETGLAKVAEGVALVVCLLLGDVGVHHLIVVATLVLTLVSLWL